MKRCSTCREWKEESEFHRYRKNKDGLKYQCKLCEKKCIQAKNKKYKESYTGPKTEWKTCSVCKKTKHYTEFNINRTKKDGLGCQCKYCQRKATKKSTQKRKENYSGPTKEWKKCPVCEETKYYTEFATDKNSSNGLCSKCKKCMREANKKYKSKNQQKVKEKTEKYRKENKQKLRKKARANNLKPLQWNRQSTWLNELMVYEKVRQSTDGYVEVPCAYCGEWFKPKKSEIGTRIESCNKIGVGEGRLYCSDSCKENCPIYNQVYYPKDQKPATSREVQPQLRQMVFERDNYTCQKCGIHKDNLGVGIHCHHILPLNEDPVQSADEDNCITLCENCHKEVHQLPGCKLNELKCTA